MSVSKRALFCVILLTVLFIGACQKGTPYEPEQVAQFHERSENLQLNFKTGKGNQVAFYVPPLNNREDPPAKIAILYPGRDAVALEWLGSIKLEDDPDTGYLLIDYPGRGFCEGRMDPEENHENSTGALKALAGHFGKDTIDAEISLMGHSFGTGAALQFALLDDAKRIVLVAPYTTWTEAVAQKSRILSILMRAEIDNIEQIKKLLASPAPPEITILHGTKDTSLPVTMGQKLAAIDKQHITYHEIPGEDHFTILTAQRDLIFHALLGKVTD